MITISIQLEIWRILSKNLLGYVNLSAKVCAMVEASKSGNDLANVNPILSCEWSMWDWVEVLSKR